MDLFNLFPRLSLRLFRRLPGTVYTGSVKHPHINNGATVPVFAPTPATDSPSINTLKGWNAKADEVNRRSFRRFCGRDPADADELQRFVDAMTDPSCALLHSEPAI